MASERLNHFEGDLGGDGEIERGEGELGREREARVGGRVFGLEREEEGGEAGKAEAEEVDEARETEEKKEIQEELEALRGKFDKLSPETKRVGRRFRKYEQGIRHEMIESDMMVAVMTGDVTKIATTGGYTIPNSLEREAFETLGKMEPEEVDAKGHEILEQIKTPVEKEGVETVVDKIMGDEKLLTRLYNLTEGWKDKYNDDSREYSEEEQRRACVEALEELTAVDKDGLNFIRDVKDKEKRYNLDIEDESRGSEPDDEWQEKRKEAREWAEGAMELGRVIYGHQFEYAEGFESRIAEKLGDKGFTAKLEDAFGAKPVEEEKPRAEESEPEDTGEERGAETWTPESNLGKISGGDFDGKAEEEPVEEESEKPEEKEEEEEEAPAEADPNRGYKRTNEVKYVESRADDLFLEHVDEVGGKMERQENGLVEGLSRVSPNDAGSLHVVERMTARAGEPCDRRMRDIFKKIELAPSYIYIPKGKEGDFHYKFSKPFMLDGDRALIYYHSYGVKRGESSTVYYDPVVLVEGEKEGEMKAVEGVELGMNGIEIEPRLKTRELRRDLNLEEIARSIIESREAIDLATEYGQRESFPVDMVKAICRRTGGKNKVAFKNWHKVVE